MKLSVIIPVYNCESYIESCVAKVLALKEYCECSIILINDGSADDSLKICRNLKERYPSHIFVKNQRNQGASAARNNGLVSVDGDYVWFVDADDEINPEIISTLIQVANKHEPDILAFNYSTVVKETRTDVILYNKEEKIDGLTYLSRLNPSMYLWNKWFSSKLIGECRFLDGTKNIEDFLFCAEVIRKAQDICTVPRVGYYYNCNNQASTSRSRSAENLKKLSEDSITVHKALNNIIQATEENERNILRNLLDCSVAGHLYSLLMYYPLSSLKDVIKEYKQMGFYPVRKSNNSRSNLFLLVANHPTLLTITYYFIRLKRKLTPHLSA